MLELREDLRGVRLHVRELEGATFGPRRLNSFGGNSYSDVSWDAVSSIVGTSFDSERLNQSVTITEAEAARVVGDDERVLELLRPLATALGPYGRKLLADSAIRSERWEVILTDLAPAQTIDESAAAVKAALKRGAFETARTVVGEARRVLGMSAPQAVEILDCIDLEEALR